MGTRVRVGLVGQATGFGLIRVDLSADEMAGDARPGHRVSGFCPRLGCARGVGLRNRLLESPALIFKCAWETERETAGRISIR